MNLKFGTGFHRPERNGDHRLDDPARAATQRLIARHGAQVMRTARRYSVTAEDAEDAYQRAVEIMLTKAPDIPDAELLPWLKTVVKHEAFAIRRQHGCVALGVDGTLEGASEAEASIAAPAPSPSEQTERFERLRLGAEAIRHLKPQEIRAMTLLAEGYSYQQICEETGWTYTKVNRCLAEGRRSFLERVAGIESGAECRRLEPKLSALADGEAGEEDLAVLRRHLRRCPACRATLREQYLAPGVIGAVAPTTLAGTGTVWESLDGLLATVKLKSASLLRLTGLDAGSASGPAALPGGSGRLVSTGLAKGLALLALGGAGAGGAAVGVTQVLDPTRPEAASAAGRESTSPGSPDPRLVAERLRPHEGGRPAARPRRKPRASVRPAMRARLRSATRASIEDAEPRPRPSRSRPVASRPEPSRSPGTSGDRFTGDRSAVPSRSSSIGQAPSSDERSDGGCRHRDDWYAGEAGQSEPVVWCPEEQEECRHPDDWYPGDPSQPVVWCPEAS